MKTFLITIVKSLYAAVAICAVAFALLFVGTRIDLFGYEVKVVKSGSMEPAVNVGGIVIVSTKQSYANGDVITFLADARGRASVTHRIIETVPTGMTTSYRTKGDANEEADSSLVRQRDVVGKVIFDLPYAGYAIDFARTPRGFLLLIGLPALLIVLDEFANIVWEIHQYRARRRKEKGDSSIATREHTPDQPLASVVRPTPKLRSERNTKAFDIGMPVYPYKRGSV